MVIRRARSIHFWERVELVEERLWHPTVCMAGDKQLLVLDTRTLSINIASNGLVKQHVTATREGTRRLHHHVGIELNCA